MIIAGVDGCKLGWIIVKYDEQNYSFGLYSTIEELYEDNQDLQRVLIDIPIGLASSSHKRTIEKQMRIALSSRSSTVFNPPCRRAVYLDDYEKAKVVNLEVEMRSISIQAFNISKKIREMDEFLIKNQPQTEWIESHPELCFKSLNIGQVVLSNKKTEDGRAERLKILSKYEASVFDTYNLILTQTKRKDVKQDDIVDALCLCIVNKLCLKNGVDFLVDEHQRDELGIKIRIGLYENP